MNLVVSSPQALIKISSELLDCMWKSEPDRSINPLAYETFSPNAIISSPLGIYKGPQALKKIMASWFDVFPDIFIAVDTVLAYGNSIVHQWKAHGTHLGSFKGEPPSGKRISFKGETIFIFNNQGKIAHYIAQIDNHQLLSKMHSGSYSPSSIEMFSGGANYLIKELKEHYPSLTDRQLQCGSLFVCGFSAKQIAIMLSISHRTVETYIEAVRLCMNTRKRVEIIDRLIEDKTFFIFQDLSRFLAIELSSKLLPEKPRVF